MVQWHIGCSGFHYREWKEAFYPKGLRQKDWFDYYAKHFNTLELNVTFYRFPALGTLQGWRSKAPAGFSFSAKVPRTVTHYKRFQDTATLLDEFYAVLQEGLGNTLGCVLFQLPPTFAYDEEKLERILQQLDGRFRNVIEFRHESWWRGDVMQRLAACNTSFCGVSFPKISMEDAIVNLPRAYYRFHGVPVLFHSRYDESFIETIYMQLQSEPALKEAYVYFNNTASMAAIGNATYFRKLVGGNA